MKIDKRRYWEIVGTVCINDTPASSADAVQWSTEYSGPSSCVFSDFAQNYKEKFEKSTKTSLLQLFVRNL